MSGFLRSSLSSLLELLKKEGKAYKVSIVSDPNKLCTIHTMIYISTVHDFVSTIQANELVNIYTRFDGVNFMFIYDMSLQFLSDLRVQSNDIVDLH